MKITNVYTEKYKWPKAKPIANGTHVFTDNELNLLVVETDEGLQGMAAAGKLILRSGWERPLSEKIL